MARRFGRRTAVGGGVAALCLALAAPLPASAKKGPDIRFAGKPTVTPYMAHEGQRVDVTIRGNLAWDGEIKQPKIYVAAYFCPDGRCGTGSILMGRTGVRTSAGGASSAFLIRARLSATRAGSGHPIVRVVADDRNLVAERDERNNVANLVFKVVPRSSGGARGSASGGTRRPAVPAGSALGGALGRAGSMGGAGAIGAAATGAPTRLLDESVLRRIQENAQRFQQELARSRGGRQMAALQRAAGEVAQAAGAYYGKVMHCASPRRAYSETDRRRAGCTGEDTVENCTRKLVYWCAQNERWRLHETLRRLEDARRGLQDILNGLDECQRYAELSTRAGHGVFNWHRKSLPELRGAASRAFISCMRAVNALR